MSSVKCFMPQDSGPAGTIRKWMSPLRMLEKPWAKALGYRKPDQKSRHRIIAVKSAVAALRPFNGAYTASRWRSVGLTSNLRMKSRSFRLLYRTRLTWACVEFAVDCDHGKGDFRQVELWSWRRGRGAGCRGRSRRSWRCASPVYPAADPYGSPVADADEAVVLLQHYEDRGPHHPVDTGFPIQVNFRMPEQTSRDETLPESVRLPDGGDTPPWSRCRK